MLPRQSDLEIPLLRCLEEMGGQGRPRDISSRLLAHFPNITQADQSETLPSGANKWKNSVAWVRQRLIVLGQLASPSRGVWAITGKGRQRLTEPIVTDLRSQQAIGTISDSVDALLPTSSRPVRAELRVRSKPEDLPDRNFENKVWKLVHDLLPKAITVGRDPEIRLGSGNIFRPDLLAIFDDGRALFVECKLTESEAYLSSWLSRFRNERRNILETFRANGWRLVSLLAVEDRRTLKDHIVDLARDLQVRILGEREIDYFDALRNSCGIGVGHLFWAQVAPGSIAQEEQVLPALRVKQGRNRDAFIFSANAHDLLSRSIVSHRELHSPKEGIIGFQRMLQKKKLREIEKHILKYNSFPTPIIIAFRKPTSPVFEPLSKKAKSAESMRGEIEFGYIRLPKGSDSLQIIDGQHRLYGYSGLPRSNDHIIHVVGYKTVKDPSPADLFVNINSKQTKVPSKLLWELYPDIYGEQDADIHKTVISRVTEAASKHYLKGHFEHISSGLKGEITFSTLCSEIKRAQLFGPSPSGLTQDEEQLRIILEAFFGTLIELGEKHPGVNDAFVLSNIGITPMIRILGRIIRFEIGQNRTQVLSRKHVLSDALRMYFEPVYQYFEQLGDTALRALRKNRIGGAGAIENDDEFTEKIRAGFDPQFPYRSKKQLCSPKWETATKNFASLLVSINDEVTDRGIMNGWVFQEFAPDKFKSRLRKPIDNEDDFESVVKVLYQIVIEGSGKGGPDNRLARLLNLQSIYDIGCVADLNVLRTYTQHYSTQIDPSKRQKAVAVLGKLAGRTIGGPSELVEEDYQLMAETLLQRITDEVLDPALAILDVPH